MQRCPFGERRLDRCICGGSGSDIASNGFGPGIEVLGLRDPAEFGAYEHDFDYVARSFDAWFRQ